MKPKKTNKILLLVFFTGLSLLLYPTVSDYWNSFHQTRAIAGYREAVAELDENTYEEYRTQAQAYNRELIGDRGRFQPDEEESTRYQELLDITGSGIMGYIEIPSINVSLPIYHGVEDSVLQVAVGHIQGSSLPVGGTGTHCVLSGHRGLPSAKLFTDLDKLTDGDVFLLYVLDQVLTYEVDQIHIVEPQDVDLLEIQEGQDLCTLVTCTPYGINSQRLLVRGHRIENQNTESDAYITTDAVQIEPVLVASIAAALVLSVLLICLFISSRKKKRR